MPAIASLEDLKAAQKDLGCGVKGSYSALSPRYSVLMRDGGRSVGRMCVEPPWERVEPFKGWVGATSRPQANGLLCRGKLWLQERTPEELKGEGSQ